MSRRWQQLASASSLWQRHCQAYLGAGDDVVGAAHAWQEPRPPLTADSWRAVALWVAARERRWRQPDLAQRHAVSWAHTERVRAVCLASPTLMVTGAYDCTLQLWRLDPAGRQAPTRCASAVASSNIFGLDAKLVDVAALPPIGPAWGQQAAGIDAAVPRSTPPRQAVLLLVSHFNR